MERHLLFGLNGEAHKVNGSSLDPTETLNNYIRNETRFTGTKLGCGEGGCGACAVDISRVDPSTGNVVHMSVNSCLRPLASMDGWAVTTTEGLGGPQKGYHPIQKRIADFNGLQCGFCTPGMVMTTYSALENSKGEISPEDIEKSLDGNICRCTGYRPIISACKSLTKGSDIEDLICNKASTESYSKCASKIPLPDFLEPTQGKEFLFEKNGITWIRPLSLEKALDLLKQKDSRPVVANTGRGVYKEETSKILVDLSQIKELNVTSLDEIQLTIGSSVSLYQTIELLKKAKESKKDMSFFDSFIIHMERIANTHVRNVGTVAGNLSMAKTEGFTSDMATLLLGVNATLVLKSASSSKEVSMEEFLSTPTYNNGEIITSITIPFPKERQQFQSYKTAIRSINSHALVNAAFLVTLNESKEKVENATLAFGGVLPHDVPGSRPLLAPKTAEFLCSNPLTQETIKHAIDILKEEITIGGKEKPIEIMSSVVSRESMKAETRQKLVIGFFYKFLVTIIPTSERVTSAATDLFKLRNTSTSTQKYTPPVSNNLAPVSEAIPKLTGPSLASGDAIFTDDIPITKSCVYGSFVTSQKARAKIISIDVSSALAAVGVVDVIVGSDVPGINTSSCVGETVAMFSPKRVVFHGQTIALVVADTLRNAERASKLVVVTYGEEESPILSTTEAKSVQGYDWPDDPITARMASSSVVDNPKLLEKIINESPHTIEGSVFIGSQQHFYMETQTCSAQPDEDGTMNVYSSVQFPQGIHSCVAKALGVRLNKVRVINKRMGGAFGGKATHAIHVACSAAVAAHKLRREVRITLGRNTDMILCGGREETLSNYSVGFDGNGKILAVKMEADLASGAFKDISGFCVGAFTSSFCQTYHFPSFDINSKLWKTNTAPRTAVRGPSELSSSWAVETMIEHIAHSLHKSPDDIRTTNFFTDEKTKLGPFTIPAIWDQLKAKGKEEEKRSEIEKFNSENRWKKRGMAKAPVRYQVSVESRPSLVNIYEDGSVVIHHGASDLGQGANIKVMQVVASKLGEVYSPSVPLSLETITTAAMDTNVMPNVTFTGGSTSSEGSAQAAMQASQELVDRLKPYMEEIIEKKKEDPMLSGKGRDELMPSWEELCEIAAEDGVNLSAFGFCKKGKTYQNFGGSLTVVELDVLTGEYSILSTHLMYDCGTSLNPAIDIGQAEGAFVMGIGHLMQEEVSYTKEGVLVNNGTWEYKPPSYRDIPQEFHVELLGHTPFQKGFLSSKASGEPPLVLANSVGLAVRQAIQYARLENGITEFISLPSPLTTDVILNACGSPVLQ